VLCLPLAQHSGREDVCGSERTARRPACESGERLSLRVWATGATCLSIKDSIRDFTAILRFQEARFRFPVESRVEPGWVRVGEKIWCGLP